jgi:hypothetical protein
MSVAQSRLLVCSMVLLAPPTIAHAWHADARLLSNLNGNELLLSSDGRFGLASSSVDPGARLIDLNLGALASGDWVRIPVNPATDSAHSGHPPFRSFRQGKGCSV